VDELFDLSRYQAALNLGLHRMASRPSTPGGCRQRLLRPVQEACRRVLMV
jgi:hypothetical protein